ncbi:type II secretion system protein [Clostridium fallax]|uniref:Prepilin-type N-terminal cleavage/methylation domain-containing protein n=1 Tax=Clostridium fallax TaxID=1533 RepID=A0A1M4YIE8_9CLOT|nr:type II secretion system protein [Clostridium fallax]SHF05292.1 prepilin-type N-terminal cleavage/methylation domain-containing protein [Clostridium fallax]SQB06325.1 pilin family protein [Clostridium fallax]
MLILRNFKRKKGFVLIELIVTLGILGIFSLIIIPSFNYIVGSEIRGKNIKKSNYYLEAVGKELKESLSKEDYLEITKGSNNINFYINLNHIKDENLWYKPLKSIERNKYLKENYIKVSIEEMENSFKVKVETNIKSKIGETKDNIEFIKEFL